MLFNSLPFALFFVVAYLVYLTLRRKAQNCWLLLASYIFYGAWDWRFLGLIALSTVADYSIALALDASDEQPRRKRLLLLSLIVNLGILGFFKYADFFSASLCGLLADFGVELQPWPLQIVLPVGISFYTFQTLGYTIDVYRRQLKPTRGFLDFALFVAFFPQLVAGPIERASRLLPQMLKPRKVTWEGFGSGCWLIVAGLFKKVVVADNIGRLVALVYTDPQASTGPEVIVATWAFAWQIYCDFSGYTDMARGLSRLLGFELMLNFKLPYLAVNPADFWRRWHISLSTWLRDYLYISLGGNRRGPLLTYRNLALTMVLGGLWHGAAWTFVIWGAYQGALLIAHRLARPLLDKLTPRSAVGVRAWWLLRVLIMFQLTCVGWMIFRADSIGQIGALAHALVSDWQPGQLAAGWPGLALLILPLAGFQLLQEATRRLDIILSWPVPLRVCSYVVIVFAIVILGEDLGAPFIYFQF